jgi:3-dehydroquinate synthase
MPNTPILDVKPPQKVRVDLAGRGYDIWIGRHLTAFAAGHIAALNPNGRVAVITDETVASLHAKTLNAALLEHGLTVSTCILPSGEGSKSYAMLKHVCEALIEAKIERGDLVVTLGGGVMGDLAGFAAAIVRRGVRFVQLPTTLLSQVDSSVGGKTGINSPQGKNLIGAFHQPSLVVADIAYLDTLSPREFRAGYAEVIKYGLINDAAFFAWCEAQWRDVFAKGAACTTAIAQSCLAKAAVVMRDEFETGDRALLNLGHTFGHAFERLVRYDTARLVHGEAVAIGLALAFQFSHFLGLCTPDMPLRVIAHLKTVGLPTRIQDIPNFSASVEDIVEAMLQDKKVQRGVLTFILAQDIGQSFVAKGIEIDKVRQFLSGVLEA